MLGVDPDHVPLPNFAERFLGYFRDPDVAFVVGPQVYGNYEGFVVRSAESQQFLFHSLLQRAGNRSRTPMLVGTNNALRLSALRQIGGFQDSITEDMATSLVMHGTRNPRDGRALDLGLHARRRVRGGGARRRSPTTSASRTAGRAAPTRCWSRASGAGASGSARARWSTTCCSPATTRPPRSPGSSARSTRSSTSRSGAGGVVVPAHLWLMLYVDAAALQVGLYFFNRRHNVSPHEKEGSAGVAGMLISALSAPIYAASLAAVALRRSRGFVTTPKGDASTRDTLVTFRKHLLWALVFGVPLALSFVLGHHHFSMRAWSFASLIVCLLPVAIWRVELSRAAARQAHAPVQAPAPVAHLRPVPDLPRRAAARSALRLPAPVPQPAPAAAVAAQSRTASCASTGGPRRYRSRRPSRRAVPAGRAAQEPRGRPL